MSFEIAIGGDAAAARNRATEAVLLLSGRWKQVIYLNGGSDTRRAVREFYEEQCRGRKDIVVEANAWSVTIKRAT